MSEIKLKLHPRYLRDKVASEEFLVKRIARMVIHVGDEQIHPHTGYKYSLNSGNEWQCSGIEDDGTITVYYRYGNGPKNSMMMDGLNRMLEWNFGEDS